MPSQAVAIPRNKPGPVVGPIQLPPPKLTMAPPDMQPWKMTPPTLSPMHMTPPNMELPNFSPIQDHMPLPTLIGSLFTPPSTFLKHQLDAPPACAMFSRYDPTLFVIGTFAQNPASKRNDPQPSKNGGSIIVYRVSDVKKEVRGDREVLHTDNPRVKLRPSLQEMSRVDTQSDIISVQFSPFNPELLLATTSTGQLLLLQIRQGRYTVKFLSSHQVANESTPILSAAFSPTDASLVAATFKSGQVALITLTDIRASDSAQIRHTIQAHSSDCNTVCFSLDGKRIYTGGDDKVLNAWTVPSRKSKNQPALKWQDRKSHERGITNIQVWPTWHGADVGHKRKALLTMSRDGKFRAFDMSDKPRPPNIDSEQVMNEKGGAAQLYCLPPLPDGKEIDKIGPGVFTSENYPGIKLDSERVGVLAMCQGAGARVIIQRQAFNSVFIGKGENKLGSEEGWEWRRWTEDGVEKDWYDREKEYEWFAACDFREHEGEVYAGSAVAIIDWDPLYKDSGKQRLRRGWRLATTSWKDRTLHFWHVYVE